MTSLVPSAQKSRDSFTGCTTSALAILSAMPSFAHTVLYLPRMSIMVSCMLSSCSEAAGSVNLIAGHQTRQPLKSPAKRRARKAEGSPWGWSAGTS